MENTKHLRLSEEVAPNDMEHEFADDSSNSLQAGLESAQIFGSRKRRLSQISSSSSSEIESMPELPSTPSPQVSDFEDEETTLVFVPLVWKNTIPTNTLEEIIREVVNRHSGVGTFMTIAGVRARLHFCEHGHVFFHPDNQSQNIALLEMPLRFQEI